MAGAVRAVRDLVARGHAERGLRERGEHHDVTFCKVTHDPELCLTVEGLEYIERLMSLAPAQQRRVIMFLRARRPSAPWRAASVLNRLARIERRQKKNRSA